jgi:hypothetical protein
VSTTSSTDLLTHIDIGGGGGGGTESSKLTTQSGEKGAGNRLASNTSNTNNSNDDDEDDEFGELSSSDSGGPKPITQYGRPRPTPLAVPMDDPDHDAGIISDPETDANVKDDDDGQDNDCYYTVSVEKTRTRPAAPAIVAQLRERPLSDSDSDSDNNNNSNNKNDSDPNNRELAAFPPYSRPSSATVPSRPSSAATTSTLERRRRPMSAAASAAGSASSKPKKQLKKKTRPIPVDPVDHDKSDKPGTAPVTVKRKKKRIRRRKGKGKGKGKGKSLDKENDAIGAAAMGSVAAARAPLPPIDPLRRMATAPSARQFSSERPQSAHTSSKPPGDTLSLAAGIFASTGGSPRIHVSLQQPPDGQQRQRPSSAPPRPGFVYTSKDAERRAKELHAVEKPQQFLDTGLMSTRYQSIDRAKPFRALRVSDSQDRTAGGRSPHMTPRPPTASRRR